MCPSVIRPFLRPASVSSSSDVYLWPRCVTGLQLCQSKVKGTVHPRTGHEGPEGELRYSPILSLTSALDGGGLSKPRPGRFTPGKETRYPLYRRLCGTQSRCGRVRKISPPTGIRSPDRPARSESPYRLSYPGPLVAECSPEQNDSKILPSRNSGIRRAACLRIPSAADRTVVALTLPMCSDAPRDFQKSRAADSGRLFRVWRPGFALNVFRVALAPFRFTSRRCSE